MIFNLTIYRPIGQSAVVHHAQSFDLSSERDAAMVLVATREALPPGFVAGMTFNHPKTGTPTNVRIIT